jgi:hypothetical protein
MRGLLIFVSILLIIVGGIISWYFFDSLSNQYTYKNPNPILMSETGQTGDFIGGVVGTLFTLSGTLLIFLSFREQTKLNQREAFEAAFFEMMRLHRENVSELSYTKYDRNTFSTSENRKVFRLIFQEFIECYREVAKFYRFTNNLIKPEYESTLNQIKTRISDKVDVKEMAMIDIAYSIVFFGIGIEGETVLRFRFFPKYDNTEIKQLFQYLRLKSKRENDTRFSNWLYIKDLPVHTLRTIIAELYNYKRKKGVGVILSKRQLDFLLEDDYEKYYGGHQFRLGHYFRHLFQSYKYLHFHKDLNSKQKYFYGKTLRAQLSTYEQALLFINSISSLGMKWELNSEHAEKHKGNEKKYNSNFLKNGLITKYNLIKNLPGEQTFGFKYKFYYPRVKYESEE